MTDIIMQCVVSSRGTTLITWLNNHRKLKKGVWVTFEDEDEPGRRWKVVAIGNVVHAANITSAHDSNLIHKKDFVRSKSGGFKNVGR